jgi:hypothetical protein
MYRSQKVHLFPPSLSFLAEAQPRLGKQQLQSKRHWKNYKFILYLPFSNRTIY